MKISIVIKAFENFFQIWYFDWINVFFFVFFSEVLNISRSIIFKLFTNERGEGQVIKSTCVIYHFRKHIYFRYWLMSYKRDFHALIEIKTQQWQIGWFFKKVSSWTNCYRFLRFRQIRISFFLYNFNLFPFSKFFFS